VDAAVILLLLAGCERDPTFYGYWDVATLAMGPTEDDAAEVTLAGFMEFDADDKVRAMFGYTWDGSQMKPDPRPDLLTWETAVTSSVDDEGEFLSTWAKPDETWTMTLSNTNNLMLHSDFDVEDWKGSSVTLVSDDALPPEPWATETDPRLFVRIELER
jgi:hypothetical protein